MKRDAASVAIDKLTIEIGAERLALYGSLDITRDKAGLRQALALQAILDQAVAALKAEPALPDQQPPAETPKMVRNPFT